MLLIKYTNQFHRYVLLQILCHGLILKRIAHSASEYLSWLHCHLVSVNTEYHKCVSITCQSGVSTTVTVCSCLDNILYSDMRDQNVLEYRLYIQTVSLLNKGSA